jgi:transglutaminase-like putative cysteine protease
LVIDSVLRHFGLAARLFLDTFGLPDVKSLDGPSGPEKILQIYMPGLVYLPGAGWIGLDPTGTFASEDISHCVAPH